ncbi:MAG: hypothetical protein KDI71_18380, partial [Xanthomonadales bacterium]|nr:hypothetical protein [Xanthomonadales bacterium]
MANWTFAQATGINQAPTAAFVNASATSSATAFAPLEGTPTVGLVPTIANQNASADATNSWSTNGSVEPATGEAGAITQQQYFQFAINTSALNELSLQYSVRRTNNGATFTRVYRSTTGIEGSFVAGPNPAYNLASQNTWYTPTSTPAGPPLSTFPLAQLNAAGLTYFRIYAFNSSNNNPGSDFYLDDVTFTGCVQPTPPTLSKTFLTTPIAIGGQSTLRFNITNPGAGLTGINFADTLPAGVLIQTPNGVSNGCGGTLTASAGTSQINLSGVSLAAGASCSLDVNVVGVTAGNWLNQTNFISATGPVAITNSGPSGQGSATIRVVAPPTLSKVFATNPIAAGGVSRLVFTVTNPNAGIALSGVAFSDALPVRTGGVAPADQMRVALLSQVNPLTTVNSCGGTWSPVAGATSVSLSSGSIPAGGSCTVDVFVTAPTTAAAPNNVYNNTALTVSHILNSITRPGTTSGATLTVQAPSPRISLQKRVSLSPTGPWGEFVTTTPSSTIYFQFTVENTGDVALNVPGSNFWITDPSIGG